MKRNYPLKNLRFACFILSLLIVASCGKDSKKTQVAPVSTAKKLGFYEIDSAGYRELLMNISKIGDHAVDFNLIFDTGSGGMVIDANGVLPASMITSTGLNFIGDSTVVNGITITNQTSTVTYGDDKNTLSTVYGNLAYAPVTVGDEKGNIEIKRLPFFIYYKAIKSNGVPYPPHEFDVFGVSSQYDITFKNNAFITSPFTHYDPGDGLVRGFKLAALGATSNFSKEGTYVPAITLGLTQADLNSGFYIDPLVYIGGDGYLPVLVANVNYVVFDVATEIGFDTGTSPYSIIEDPNGPEGSLPAKTNVYVTTTSGFKYNYTVTADQNQTVVENPAVSGSSFTILGLDFFLNNEYLLDLQNHQLGIKNN